MDRMHEVPEPSERCDVQHVPRVDDRLLAALHRRAGEAAILRDQRLEIAVGPEGRVVARVVDGASR